MLSARKAAKRLACAPDYVGKLCREGKLEGERINNAWFVKESSIAAFEKSRASARMARAQELAEERQKEQEVYRKTKGLRTASFLHSAAGKSVAFVLGGTFLFASLVYAGGIATPFESPLETGGSSQGAAVLASVQSPFFAAPPQTPNLAVPSSNNFFASVLAFLFGNHSSQTVAVSPAQPVSPTPVSAVTTSTPAPVVSEKSSGRLGSLNQTFPQQQAPASTQTLPQSAPAPIANLSSYVTQDALTTQLNELSNNLRQVIFSNINSAPGPVYSSGGNTNNIALSQIIDRLSNVVITGGSITGANISGGSISGLNGIDLASGCFSVAGVCITSGGNAAGSTGAIQFNTGGAFDASSTEFVWDAVNNRLGVGTANPTQTLSLGNGGVISIASNDGSSNGCFAEIAGQLEYSNDCSSYQSFTASAAGGWTDTGTVVHLTTNNEQVGIGTTTPYAKLTVWGVGLGNENAFEIANSASTTLFAVNDAGQTTLVNLLATGGTTLQQVTATNATTSVLYASTFGLGAGNYFTSLLGTGLSNNAGVLTVSTTSLGLLAPSSLSATAPLAYNSTTGAFSILQSGLASNGYLSSTDFTTFNNKISSSSLSGTNGVTYNGATGAIGLGTIGIANGGTGTGTAPSYGQLLVGNSTGGYNLLATSSLGIIGGGGGTFTSIGPASQLQSGPSVTLASSTLGNDFSITASGNLITYNLPSASLGARGLLTPADYATFENKISSSSLSGANGITYNGGTGVIGLGTIGVVNGGTGTSTAPVYGQLLLGNAAGGYSLVSTSSLGIAASGNPSWGNIVGTLSNQTDLQNALNAKLNLSDWYATTTDGLKQGITNLYYNNALVNAFIDASSTIPKTYTANIFSNANTFNGATSLQNLSVTGTGTSTFAGNIGISGSIIPSVANTYSLGSAANTWKDIYVGPGSLYVNGQEVLHTDASNDVVVSSDVNENLVMQTTGTANIEINPSGTGALLIKSGVTLTGGKSFNTSDSSAVLFPSGTLAGNIQISGSTISVPSLTNGGISISPNGNGGTYITNGNFGVDTTNPTQALSVNGSAYISNNLTTANITATGTLQVSGNTTLAQATTTNLAISNITSTLLKTNANGSVVPAVAGTDYQAPGGYLTSAVTSLAATYPLQVSGSTGAVTLSTNFGTTTANLYSSLQTFGAGFVSQASSTIGNGTQTGGLTIAGGATTTGSLQVNGGITVNGSLKLASVTGSVQCLHVGANGIISGTGSDCGTGGGGGSSTFLGLTDVPSSYVANQVYYTNATADAVTASNNFTFDGTTLTAPTVSASTLTISGSSSFGTVIAGVWHGTPIANAYVAHNLTINGGSIDNSPIGATTPSTGVFTNATSTNLTAYQSASFGATATSSFANNGALTLSQALGIGSGGTGTSTAPSYGQLLLGNGTGGYNLISTSSLGINSATWGNISGTLASQTDLQNALNAKLNISDEIGYPFPNNATSTKLNLSGGVQVGALTGFIGGNNGTLYGIASSSLNLPNAALQNSSLTINGTTFNLGDNKTITAASSTVLTDSNTFSGNNIFTNLITGSVSGNAGTVTNGVYTTTFGNLFDNRLSASSSIAGITTLPNLASINNYSGLIAGNSGKLYQVSTSSLNASITGNAGTVTNGVYTTDTGTVTNTMLAGSIANNKLVNSSITVNGTTFNLGDNKIIPMSSTTLLTDTNTFSGVNNFTNASSNFAGTWQGLSASNFDTFAYPFIANATSSQIAFNGGLTASTILATASTTLQNFTGVNATTTNATTTSFAISNIVSGILATNANGSVRPLTVGSGLTFDGTTLTTSGIGITSIGPAGQTQNGGTQLLATSTNGTDFTITASGNTQTFNLPFASLTSNGKLSLADYATFNNKLSSSSLSGGNGINYAPSTGIITNTGVVSLAATYPLQTSASTGNLTISTAFGTTTNNVFSGTNTFNAASAFTAFASFANASSSQISAATGFFNYLNATSSTATSTFAGGLAVGSNALTVLQNGTVGIGNSTPGKTFDVTGTGRFSSTLTLSGSPSCTGNQALQTDSQGNVVCGALAIANASTGGGWTTNNIGTVSLSTTTDMVAVGATTTPYAKLTVLSSNTASTTLALVAASGQTANVIDIYNSTGALNSVFTSAGNFGLGSTSPAAKLGVNGNGFFAGNLTATGALNVGGNTLVATAGGNVGLGSSTPASHLAIAGGDITHVAAGNPSIAATVSEIGSAHAYGTYVSGHYAYVADYQGGLRVIDITNPAVPTTVGSNSSYIASPAADAVVVAGKYAYVADQNFGLVIFDVSNPAAPNAVGTYALSGTTQSLALSGRYLYINDFNNHAVRIIDVSNPAAPTLAGSLLPPGGTNSLPIALAISGKYLYVGDQLPAIYVVDVSNPAAPAIVGTYNNSSVVGGPAAMYVSGKYLYVADQVTGLYTLSVSNPASPALVGQYPPSHSAYYNGVQAAGTNLYVADHSGNTLVLDMSTPTAPSLVGSIASAGTPNSIFVAGKYAYVADDSHGLDVVDINGLSTPAANIGSLAANSVDVSDSLNVGQNIFAGGGLDVGAGGIFSRGGLAVLGTTTLQNFTGINATTTNATSTSLFATTASSTNLFTSNLSIASLSGLLKATNGAVSVATAGVDYATAATINAFKDWNIVNGYLTPTTTLGVIVSASSTIGNGTQAGGLTVNGGATTTGNAYFAGNVGIGTANPSVQLHIQSNSTVSTAMFLDNTSTGGTTWNFQSVGSGVAGRIGNLEIVRAGTSYGISVNPSGYLGVGLVGQYPPKATLDVEGTAGVILNAGNVGIGTTSPFSKLSLAGAAGGTTNLFAISTSTSGYATSTALTIDQNGNLSLLNGAGLTVNGATSLNTLALTQALASTYGGTGQNFSSSNGLAAINAGVFSALSTTSMNASITGNAGTATALQNARTINGVSFNGTANIVVASTTLLGDTNTFSGNNTFSNLITGNISGNAATVTTNANLTGVVTSVGNTTSFATSPTFTGTLTVPNLLATASSTFQNFTGVNATTTNATTTSFAISNIASGNLLKTTTGGALVAAVAGVDYSPAGADTFAYPFPLNATSTKLNFSGGVQVGTLAGFIGANSGTLYQIASSSLNLPNAALQNSSLTINGTAVSLGGSITVASTTLLGDNNTFSGTDTFNNTITGSVSGNAATVTNGVYTGTFNGLFDPRFITDLAATTSVNSITALSNLASVGTITSGIWNGTAIGDSYIASAANWNTAYSDRITSATYPLSISSNVISTVATSSLNLTTSSFLSPNISQWTNNAGYLTSLSGAASSTLLGDTNTWSGTDIFNNLITGSISGNAGTATKLAATKTINSVAFDGSANITITAASSSLLGDFNTFSGTDYFNNPIKIGTLGGLIAGNGGLTYAVSTTSMNASITGNAGTATALASAPTKCSAGNYTLGIDVNGNAQGCTAAGTGTVTQVNTNYSMTGGGFTTSGTLAVATSSLYTGLTGGLPYFSGTNTFGAIAAGTGGYVLSMSGGIPAWVATSSINNGVTSITASAPLTGGTITTTGSIGCTTASSGVAGCLGSTAFDTFNNKQAALSTPTYPLLLTGTTLSTAFGTTTNSGMTAGNLYVGSNGVFQTSASSSIFGYTPLNPTRNVNTTYPLQGGGALTGDLTLTSAFGTTTTWGMGNNGLVMTGSTGIPFSQATSSAIAMSISGNAATVTNGVYTTGVGSVFVNGSGTNGNCVKWLTSNALGDAGAACGSGGSGLTVDPNWNYFQATGGNYIAPTSTTVGIGVFASSTIGNGTQAGGLTISGGATTTGNLSLPAGAQSLPSLNFGATSGYNTGIWSPGAGDVYVTLNGANRVEMIPGSTAFLQPITAYNFGVTSSNGPGNGIYLPAANTLGFAANSTLVGEFSSSGNFGIGTTSPFAKLSLAGTNGGTTPLFAISTSTSGFATTTALTVDQNGNLSLLNGAGLTVNGASAFTGLTNFNGGITAYASSTIGNGTQAGGLTISGGATTTGNAYFKGNVGIGTVSSSYSLQVNGNALFGASIPTYIPASPLNLVNSAVGTLQTQLTLVNTGGSPGAGSAIDFYTYDVSGGTLPGIRLAGLDDNYSGDFTISTKTPGGAVNPLVERFRITNTGNVGIGTTSPFAKLSLAGTNGGTTPLFAISTSTSGFATTTALTVDQNGNLSLLNGAGLTVNGASAFTGLTNFNGGITAYASSTIGNGTQAGGLTISGGATTTGNAYFAGNVGIGVAAPTQKLTVAGGGIKLDNAQNIYWRNSANTADTAVFTLSGDTTILRGGGGTPTLQLQNSGGTPVETLLENGTVGIGTTSPYGKISISGPDTGAGFAFALADSANAPVFTIQDNGIFTYGKNSTSTIPNNTPYAWTIATSTTGAPLFSISTVSGSELTTIGVPNSNVFIGDVGAPANLVFQESSTIETSGGKTLTIGAGSDIVNFGVNVGIGSTTPATTLSVSGNGYFTGGVGIGIENNTAGTLQTSGNGLFGGSVGVGTATPLSALTVNGGTTIGADYNTAAPTNGLLVEGKVGIGTTSPASNFTVVGSLSAATSSALTGFLASFVNTAGNTNSNGIAIEGGSNSTKGAALISFYRPDGTNIGGVTQTSATAVAYNTTSDRRVKEDIATTTSGLAQLLQIPVRDFDYINDPAHATTTGFIAQELYSVFPEAVTTNGDNGTVPLMPGQTPWQVDYGRITPLIVKSVQDLAASSVRISNGIVNFSNAATTTIAIGSGTWTIATSSATGTLPIISISAPASSTPSVSINGVLYVNGQNIASAIASTTGATSTPAALVAGPFATSTPTLQNALFTMLNALSGVAQSGVRELGVAVHASAGIFDSLVTQTLTATTINADTVNASQKLCIGTTCVTESQLQQLLGSSQSAGNNGSANSGSGSGSSPSGQSLVASSSDTVAPTVTLNGDNPATITVGDTYADLGASVSDTGVGQAGNANLGLSVSVDGGATTTPSQIIINTSSAGTHTIIYSAVDQNGLTGSATRTVNVVAQDASSTPAN